MAATSFPSSAAAADYAADKAVRTTRATNLRDIDECSRRCSFQVYFTAVSTTETSYDDIASFYITIPDHSDGQRLHITIEAKVGADTGQVRLQDDDTSNASDEYNITATSYADLDMDMTIQSGWEGRRLFNVRAKHASGETFVQSDDKCEAWFADD